MYKVLYKVMKADCTSLIGIVVMNDDFTCLFIPKDRISDYEYSNIRITKNGSIFPKDRTCRKYTRGNGNIIVETEWNALLKAYYYGYEIGLPFANVKDFKRNVQAVQSRLNLPR